MNILNPEENCLSYPKDLQKNSNTQTMIDFIKSSSGLAVVVFDQHMEISQKLDGKCIPSQFSEIQEVIERIDTRGKRL